MTILTALIAFLITIGILVAVHEYGHFWVARKLGVKVLRFSIGFGKPLWQHVPAKDPDKTEYVIAAIPFGGYVKMLDRREGEVPEEEAHREFTGQPIWKRFLIVLAGPMFNFIFAVFAYALMYSVGVEGIKPFIDQVRADSPAAIAGFEPRDRIIAINDQQVESLADTSLVMLDEYLKDKSRVQVTVQAENGGSRIRTLDLSELQLLKEEQGQLEKIGIEPWLPYLPMVGNLLAGGAAEAAGLKPNDKIISANGFQFQDYKEFSPFIQKNGEKPVELVIERDDQRMNVTLTPKKTLHEGKEKVLVGIGLGGYVSQELHDRLYTIVRYSPLEAFQQGAAKTWQMTALTFKFIGRLFTGEASIKNISGPVTIANYAGKSMVIGFSVFIGFLAIVSISLGVMNLLPVPMLDGGHLLFYTIEAIKGSPVSEAVQEVSMRVGVAMVGTLMVLAFYNDILRLL